MHAENDIFKALRSEAEQHFLEICIIGSAWALTSQKPWTTEEQEIANEIVSVRTDRELACLLQKVGKLRRELLVNAVSGNRNHEPNGRLLVTDLNAILEDGHAQTDSEGHLSLTNVPRPYLWVSSYQLLLISWIPAEIEQHVDLAVQCNPERSLRWLDE